jgi:hypothetical protein
MCARIWVMEMQVHQVTLEILREIDILSDTEGRYIFHLANIYINTYAFLKLTERNIKAFFKLWVQKKKE